jgi:2-aminoethylphosphonate-pyruvate transaminase
MLLLIPGPVTTRPEVRAALMHDFAPWDRDFAPLLAGVRARVRDLAGGREGEHAGLPLQGCGHFGMEAAIRTFIPAGGRLLIPACGQYAVRMRRLAREAGRVPVEIPVSPTGKIDPAAVAAALAADPSISHVGIVYSETSTGVVHDVDAIGAVVGAAGRRMIVDAVSAFGALPFDIAARPETDAVVFSANKCLEGVPGLAFVVAPVARLDACAGNAGSWSFDLSDILAQERRSGPGSFRFTPPAQVLNAFRVALELHEAEGGAPARLARYRANMRVVYEGAQAIGLSPSLPESVQGPIVVNIDAPEDPSWNLQFFVDALKAQGFLISNFYDTAQPSFRVGCIGALLPDDMRRFVAAMDLALERLGIRQRKAA